MWRDAGAASFISVLPRPLGDSGLEKPWLLSVCLEGKQTHNELHTFSPAMQCSRGKLLTCGLTKHELGSDEDGAAFMLSPASRK